MAISNCWFWSTSENPCRFSAQCVLAKLRANPRNYSQPKPLYAIEITKQMELIKCDNCKSDFKPTSGQLNFILTSKEKGMTFIMLECGNCGISFSYNPLALKELDKTDEIAIRTPISGSHGYISFVDLDNEKFYGCGETGAIWRDKSKLFRDIEIIINQYPHRALCYKKTNSGWIANSEEPDNINELIDQEVVADLMSLERD